DDDLGVLAREDAERVEQSIPTELGSLLFQEPGLREPSERVDRLAEDHREGLPARALPGGGSFRPEFAEPNRLSGVFCAPALSRLHQSGAGKRSQSATRKAHKLPC